MATAVVTGANKGIGLALCGALADQNWSVIAACRRASPALASLPVEVAEGIDVSTDEGEQRLRQAVAGRNVDLVIANAGLFSSGTLDGLELDALRAEFEVNALGALRTVRACLPSLGWGAKIAVISSRAGSIADNLSGGSYGYRMSKAALNMAAVTLARDLAPRGIAVVVLHPGAVDTELFRNAPGAQQMATGMQSEQPDDVAGPLLERITELSLQTTGRFLTRTGDEIPWYSREPKRRASNPTPPTRSDRAVSCCGASRGRLAVGTDGPLRSADAEVGDEAKVAATAASRHSVAPRSERGPDVTVRRERASGVNATREHTRTAELFVPGRRLKSRRGWFQRGTSRRCRRRESSYRRKRSRG
jgi:NAD(P)-dependent dehydrogenase (short-subunit alcohol dehydrogenase family)